MSSKFDVVFVERYFFPEGWGGAQIPRDITVELSRAGFRVAVVCGRDQYIREEGVDRQDPRDAGVSIWYVPRFRFAKSSSKGIVSQLWFCVTAALTIVLRGRPMLFIVQTNPPLVVVFLSAISTILRRRMILVAQDLYPEVMIAHGILDRESLRGRILLSMFRRAYQRAACVVSLGSGMTARLLKKGVQGDRIREISNWATGDPHIVRGPANLLVREWGVAGRFVVLYSGNLGVAHDAPTIVRAFAGAKTQLARLCLVFVGEGGRIDETRRLVAELGLGNFVLFKPPVPMELLPHALGAADLALVTLLPGFEGLVVPSKLLGHMARGVPTMYIGPKSGDIPDLLARSGGGVSVANGDIETASALLIELSRNPTIVDRMGAAAAHYYIEHLSRELGLTAYRSLVQSFILKQPE
jgi:colanic acid biosynthesis glycosyl transferase WcaI